MEEQGFVGVSLVLSTETWAQIDGLAQAQGHSNRRSFLDQYLRAAEACLDPGSLVLPPRRRKGTPTRQDKIMLPRERIPYLNRIKAELGLSRADAIHALLLTMANP